MYVHNPPEMTQMMRDIMQLAKQIREKKVIMKDEARITKASTKPIMPRTSGAKVRDRSVAKLKEQMEDMGVDMEDNEKVSLVYIYNANICCECLILIRSLPEVTLRGCWTCLFYRPNK